MDGSLAQAGGPFCLWLVLWLPGLLATWPAVLPAKYLTQQVLALWAGRVGATAGWPAATRHALAGWTW